MKYLKVFLLLSNLLMIIKLVTFFILGFIVLILDNHQLDSLFFILIVTLSITDILFFIYIYLKLKRGKLEKIKFLKTSKNIIIFWSILFIFWLILLMLDDDSRKLVKIINIYACFMIIYLNVINGFIIYNNKGILKRELFNKFIFFEKIRDVQYPNDEIIISTENRVYKYNKSENRNKYLKKILREYSPIDTPESKGNST